jgi:hypothetical protein
MKDMVSIRKMDPGSLGTIFGLGGEVDGAASMTALSTEADEDFFRGDNRLV